MGLVALTVGWIALATAGNEAPTARMIYQADVTPEVHCPDEQWIRTAVSARLGRDPFREDGTTSVRAKISGTAGQLRAEVEVTRANGRSGRRTLESSAGDCLELASALELAIALAIEPKWLAPAPVAPVPVPVPAPVVVEPARAEPEPIPVAPEPPLRWGIHLSILGTAGSVPAVSTGLSLGASIDAARFRVAVEGRALWPTAIEFGFGRATVFGFTGSLVPCVLLGAFEGCGVVHLGVSRIESTAAEVKRATTFMAQVGPRVGWRFALTEQLSLTPWIEGAVILTRTSIVSGASTLWVTWPVSISAGLRLEFKTPS